MTISKGLHSVKYETTFSLLNPTPNATNLIRKIHLNLLSEDNLLIKLIFEYLGDINSRAGDSRNMPLETPSYTINLFS